MPIKATVKIVTFHNPDNGYSVLKLTESGSGKAITAVGQFPRLSPGETLEMDGEWTRHEVFGEQFKAAGYRLIPPDSLEAIERYLGGGIFRGVGPGLARRLVARFGLETFDILDRHPERLDEVPRLKGKAREALLESWKENKAVREVMYFLQAHNLSANMSARVYKQYGAAAVEVLRANPYRMAEDVAGIGFLKADEVAGRIGFARDGYERIKAGLAHVLGKSAEEGHVFLGREEILRRAAELLRCDAGKIVFTLDNLSESSQVRKEGADGDERYYLPYLWHSERGIARRLSELVGNPPPLRDSLAESAIAAAEEAFRAHQPDFGYSDRQRGGILEAARRGVFLLTGGPGTGKTTTVLGLLEVLERAGLKVLLGAPTGRAAKRLAEVTGHPAATLHRLLKYDPSAQGFSHDELSPLPCDALVVDEVSMIDTVLMYALLKAVKPGTRLVLIGDPDQLPSVGPGKVLAEIIRSGAVPHLHLEAIFRQAEASQIVANAHRIHRGEPLAFARAAAPAAGDGAAPATPAGRVATAGGGAPLPEAGKTLPEAGSSRPRSGGFYFLPCGDVQDAPARVAELVCDRLPGRFGYHPLLDVQVLSPMNQGPLGTLALNQALQARLNPLSPGVEHRDRILRVRDKVMQLRNDYDKNVFNGDIGYVKSVSAARRVLTVDFDGEEAAYEGEELDQLALAYAVSVHKSQGSEFKAVVLLMARPHWVMLQRNLLYTGVTRARENLFLVGHEDAVRRAVENNPAVLRNTRLAEALGEEMSQYAF